MNLFELFVKVGVDDKASEALKNITGKLGNGLKTAAKIGTAAVGVASAGIAALTKSAVDNYAEYEQLVGGVETLFKGSADTVKKYADEAYKSAGLSANEYMSTVTGFSASLLQSLGRGAQTDIDALKENLDEQYDATKKSWQERIKLAKKMKKNNVAELEAQMDAELKALKKGNEQKLADAEAANNKSVVTAETQSLAADLANQAVIDMADNANKMGTSMELIQNAYQGFAKQNYTMLDNLKLGYGGTKEEMERLVKDAAALDSSIDANSMSFANIVKAINVVQTEMGITGTTAREAASTIQGSVGMMKSSWSNLVTGLADQNADMNGLVANFVDSVGTVAENILPVVETALSGVASLIEKLAPKLIEMLPSLVEQVVPSLISAATQAVNAIVAVLPSLIDTIVTALVENAPALITAAVSMIQALIDGISQNLNVLVDGAIMIVQTLVTELPKLLPQIIQLGIDLLLALVEGIAEALNGSEFVSSIVDVVMQMVEVLTNPTTLTRLLDASLKIITELAFGLVDNIDKIIEAVFSLITGIVSFLVDPKNLGKVAEAAVKIVVSLAGGLLKAIPQLLTSVGELIGKVFDLFADADWGEIWQGIQDAFASVSEWFSQTFEEAKQFAVNAWNNAKGLFSGVWNGIKGVFSSIGGWFSQKFTEGKNSALAAWDNAKNLFGDVWTGIKDIFSKGADIGKNIIEGIKQGIRNAWNNLKEWFSGLFDDLIGIAKKILGIASPSKVFKKIGAFTAEGFGIGFDDAFGDVEKDIEGSLDFGGTTFGVDAYGSYNGNGIMGSVGGTSFGTVNINIDGANVQNDEALADMIAERLQTMTERRGAVFA